MIDLKPLWTNISQQALIMLAIVGIILIIAGVLTQGFGRTLGAVAGVFLFAAIIIMLGNLQAIGEWIKGLISTGNSGQIVLSHFLR